MQFIVPAFLILALIVVAIVFPPAIACLFMLVSNAESPGITQAFIQYFRMPEVCSAGVFLIAALRAIQIVRTNRKKNVMASRIYTLSVITLALCFWVGVSSYLGGKGLTESLRASLLSGIPGVIIAAVYFRNPLARFMFVSAVIAQLLLAYCIISFPGGPLDFLKPQFYGQDGAANDVGILATGIIKASGQFINAGALSFYGAIGIVLGVYLLAYNRKILAKLAGLGALYLGIWASIMTVERAVWVGTLIALIILMRPLAAKPIGKFAYALMTGAVLSFLILAIFSFNVNPAISSLLDHFTSLSAGSNYRISAAKNSVDILLEQPLFGMNGDVSKVVKVAGGAPHQAFYFFSVVYGIPAGIGVLLMIWWTLASKFSKHKVCIGQGLMANDRYLAHSIGWVVLLLALSNNMSAGVLGWICLGYACLPWADSSPYRKEELTR